MTLHIPFLTTEERMARNADGKILISDFHSGEGKYITNSFKSGYDVELHGITKTISLRLTYINKKNDIIGIKLTKIGKNDGALQELTLSTVDIQKLISHLVSILSIDLKSLAKSNLIIDSSIVNSPQDLEKFLLTVNSDENGREILHEFIKNLDDIEPGALNSISRKKNSVTQMEKLLNDPNAESLYKQKYNITKPEQVWQHFFENNKWTLGSDTISILSERNLDEKNIMDIPVKSLDGYMDIVELKQPKASIWTSSCAPTSDLSKALMQCMRYIKTAETKSNNVDKIKDLNCEVIKPRATLIIGRSIGWSDRERSEFRILNDGLSNITVLTYDHVLQRCKSIINYQKEN